MRKKVKSVLDPFREQLEEMDEACKTLPEIQQWLAEQGLKCCPSAISNYLAAMRSLKDQERILQQVISGSEQCRKVDQAFAENPEPKIDSLIKLFKTLIFQLSVKGAADPQMLKLSNALTRTVCSYLSTQTRAEFKKIELDQAERKLRLIEEKAQQADAARQVAGSKLTPEEKEAEYRRIFGMA